MTSATNPPEPVRDPSLVSFAVGLDGARLSGRRGSECTGVHEGDSDPTE